MPSISTRCTHKNTKHSDASLLPLQNTTYTRTTQDEQKSTDTFTAWAWACSRASPASCRSSSNTQQPPSRSLFVIEHTPRWSVCATKKATRCERDCCCFYAGQELAEPTVSGSPSDDTRSCPWGGGGDDGRENLDGAHALLGFFLSPLPFFCPSGGVLQDIIIESRGGPRRRCADGPWSKFFLLACLGDDFFGAVAAPRGAAGYLLRHCAGWMQFCVFCARREIEWGCGFSSLHFLFPTAALPPSSGENGN